MNSPSPDKLPQEVREAIARVLSAQHGCAPDELEPGDAYGIDGRMKNGDPAHFNWRRFLERADEVLAGLARPSPAASGEGTLRTLDHPEANGRKAVIGESAYTLTFTHESGKVIKVEMGQEGFATTTNLLMDMLSNAPSHDDGSTTLTTYQKLRNRMESAECRNRVLEAELLRLTTLPTAAALAVEGKP